VNLFGTYRTGGKEKKYSLEVKIRGGGGAWGELGKKLVPAELISLLKGLDISNQKERNWKKKVQGICRKEGEEGRGGVK